jgi:DnaJ-class molecular chaperone
MTQTKKSTLVLIKGNKCYTCDGEGGYIHPDGLSANSCEDCKGVGYYESRAIIVCDDGSKKGELTLFPNTINGVPNFNNVTIKMVRKAQWDYASNGSVNFKVLVDTPQIPQNVLDAIVSGQLKDGYSVEVKMKREPQPELVKQVIELENGKAIVGWTIFVGQRAMSSITTGDYSVPIGYPKEEQNIGQLAVDFLQNKGVVFPSSSIPSMMVLKWMEEFAQGLKK